MAKPFDSTLKTLYEASPIDFPRLCGYPAEHVSPIDADTSIVSGAADKAIRVTGNPDWIMHVEFQSGPDRSLPQRMNLDSLILHDRTELQVRTAVILLHRKANLRAVNGRHAHQFPGDAEPYRTFHYQVIRLWELPVEMLLQGGPSSVALAPLANVAEEQLPGVIDAMEERYKPIADRSIVARLWTATEILMGLTHEAAEVVQLLAGVMNMEESTTYQAIIQKGENKGAVKDRQESIRELGESQFGPIPLSIAEKLAAINSLPRLKQIFARVLRAQSWDEIFDEQ
jgi:predicted transposase YdaD